jgi:hypothetical protein
MSTTTDTFARFVDLRRRHRRGPDPAFAALPPADAGVTDLGAGDPMGWVAEHA